MLLERPDGPPRLVEAVVEPCEHLRHLVVPPKAPLHGLQVGNRLAGLAELAEEVDLAEAGLELVPASADQHLQAVDRLAAEADLHRQPRDAPPRLRVLLREVRLEHEEGERAALVAHVLVEEAHDSVRVGVVRHPPDDLGEARGSLLVPPQRKVSRRARQHLLDVLRELLALAGAPLAPPSPPPPPSADGEDVALVYVLDCRPVQPPPVSVPRLHLELAHVAGSLCRNGRLHSF
mmetsp:Transcript_13660/g.32366  ORF Transcript_13660/g.32366 Transcript_13660/m.32366 type:complete len:234 (-) Transcript_13660:633-1334(-)